jgi:hypothetical protein
MQQKALNIAAGTHDLGFGSRHCKSAPDRHGACGRAMAEAIKP